MNCKIKLCVGLVTVLSMSGAIAEPVVPGFDVEIYAEVPFPRGLAFDPDGVLYVGNNATNQVPIKIHRVGVGGTPVEEYGNNGFLNPDNVAFDASGSISGEPGSVLVFGATFNSSGGLDEAYIGTILPDENTTTLFSGSPLVAPQTAVFDQYGRLLIGDFLGLFVTTGGALELLTPPGFSPTSSANFFDLDGAGRIFFANEVGPPFDTIDIRIVTADGSLLEEPFFRFQPSVSNRQLAFAPFDSVWDGALLAMSFDGVILRIDKNGTVSEFGHGFSGPGSPTFGPDGALYVSSESENLVYRITPAELMSVTIDIKPDSDKNPVNPKSRGKLKVAIITSDELDASTVDVASVRFGPGKAEPVWYRLDDVDYDGDLDLALKFKTQETGITCGDTEATLIAETFSGQNITGTDSVKTVGCKNAGKQNNKGK